MIKAIIGGMKSGKSLELIQTAEREILRKKNVGVFYANLCSNGLNDMIESRDGKSIKAIGLTDILDVYNYIGKLDVICIDEISFLSHRGLSTEDFINLIRYCDLNGKDLILSGLTLDFAGNSFIIVEKILPHCDSITVKCAICEVCGDFSKHNVRFVDGKLSEFDEDILMTRELQNVKYVAMCPKCKDKAYKGNI